jgi:hypothetical protein
LADNAVTASDLGYAAAIIYLKIMIGKEELIV